MASRKRDPLEDAVMTNDVVDPWKPEVATGSETPAAKAEEPKMIAVPPKSKPSASYKVLEDVRIPWFKAQFISLHVGDVVSDAHYGDGAMQRFIDSGVKLEEV